MTPAHEVWTRSLEGKGVNLTEICIFRTLVTIVWTTFDFTLGSPKCHFLLKSGRTGDHPETPEPSSTYALNWEWYLNSPDLLWSYEWGDLVVPKKKESAQVLWVWTFDSGLTKSALKGFFVTMIIMWTPTHWSKTISVVSSFLLSPTNNTVSCIV